MVAHCPRFYCDTGLRVAAEVELDAARAHHLVQVLRLRQGDEIRLFNPRDGEFRATITEAKKSQLRAICDEQLVAPSNGIVGENQRVKITLWFAAVKRDVMDSIVEKTTELGIDQLQPIITDHTAATRVGMERLAALALAASEQCGRLSVPILLAPQPIRQLLEQSQGKILACCEASVANGNANHLVTAVTQLTDSERESLVIVIGPEGGFSASEFALFSQHPRVSRVSLGEIILRCDTAAISAVATVQALLRGG